MGVDQTPASGRSVPRSVPWFRASPYCTLMQPCEESQFLGTHCSRVPTEAVGHGVSPESPSPGKALLSPVVFLSFCPV